MVALREMVPELSEGVSPVPVTGLPETRSFRLAKELDVRFPVEGFSFPSAAFIRLLSGTGRRSTGPPRGATADRHLHRHQAAGKRAHRARFMRSSRSPRDRLDQFSSGCQTQVPPA